MVKVKCYTDGSFINQGAYLGVKAGAWAYKIIIDDEDNCIECGNQIGAVSSTVMEMEAIKQLLIKLNNIKSNLNDTKINIYSDCLDIVNKINSIKNQEIIKLKNKSQEMYGEIINLIKLIGLKIKFKWVKSHANDINNNHVDLLAREQARKVAKEFISSMDFVKQYKPTPSNAYKYIYDKTIKTKKPTDAEGYIPYNKIIMPRWIVYNIQPTKDRVDKKYAECAANKGIKKAIEVEKRGNKFIIKDGYISYLWLRENREYWIPVKLKKETQN